MANLRDIRRRIKSVKGTAQITRAMQLVAASKMKKAQDQALAGRAYSQRLNQVLANIAEALEGSEVTHPLLERRVADGEATPGSRTLVLLISTDKGLCGGLNTNLLRKVAKQLPEDAQFVTVGSRGQRFLARAKRNLLADFHIKDPVPFAESKKVAQFVVRQFTEGKVDRVLVAFTNFVNTLSQVAEIQQLLPVENPGQLQASLDDHADESVAAAIPAGGLLFEPSAAEVFDYVLPLTVNFMVYQMLLEARASEHSARMVAMKSATDNAKNLVSDLTLEYNKLRQAAITSELLEITTAMKALE